jgi:hypothetical protein
MRPRRAAVLIALVGTVVSGGVAGASAERGAMKQPTYANLVGPLVVQADGFVTLRGLIGIRGSSGHVSSGYVAIQSRPAGTPNWTTLNRVALKSAGTFVFRTPVGATGTQGGGNVFFRVVFAGDASHGPSSQQSTTEVVAPVRPTAAAAAADAGTDCAGAAHRAGRYPDQAGQLCRLAAGG